MRLSLGVKVLDIFPSHFVELSNPFGLDARGWVSPRSRYLYL